MDTRKLWTKLFGFSVGDRIVLKREIRGLVWSKFLKKWVRTPFHIGVTGRISAFPLLKKGGYRISLDIIPNGIADVGEEDIEPVGP